jgi:hypothetical protein
LALDWARVWVPILESTRAAPVLQAIADALRVPPPPYGGRLRDDALAVALFSREPGFALYHAYAGGADHEDLARECLATAVERLQFALHRPYFAYGFSGLAWTLQHLGGWIVEAEEDSLEALDIAVATVVDSSESYPDYALAKGLVGYAIYAYERLPRPRARATLERIVERLVAEGERSDAGLTWRIPVERVNPNAVDEYPNGMLVVGVMEGTVGVISALAAAARVGIAAADAAISEALSWVATQVRDGVPAVAGGKIVPPSWAHGGVGIAAALLATGRPDCRELGLALGRNAVAQPVEVRDASFMRGSAGIAHSFNRLYQATGDDAYRTAACAWLEHVLAQYRPNTGCGGYLFWGDEWVADYIPELIGGWIEQAGLLEGIAGVGLVLLAATTAVEPQWDRCMLLSTKHDLATTSRGRRPRPSVGGHPRDRRRGSRRVRS